MKATEAGLFLILQGTFMKLLFFQWHSFMNEGMERALKKLNIEYDTYFYQFTDWEADDAFLERFEAYVKKGDYGFVLSVNFSPLISEVCERRQIPYISWIYDSPVHIRNLSSMKNACSRIYVFDRGQAEEYRKAGIAAMHMPLAVDTELFESRIAASKAYRADISFVGALYQTRYQAYAAFLSEYRRGYLEGIIRSQMKLYGGYLIPDLITEDLLEDLNEDYKKKADDGFLMGKRELEFMLACETTGRERYLALSLLSGHYPVNLHSPEMDERLKNVSYRGYADYYGEMPAIFAGSKVNLNISLKTIRSGIPLRVLDIMGCGGFALSNFQEELAEYFVPGEECAVYENLEDLFLKADYYLKHEEERKRIAAAGRLKVKRHFTFEERLGDMLAARSGNL